LNQQRDWIRRATAAVHRASGVVPGAFRAPNLWIGETTFQVLEEEGYQIDSSVPSGRILLGYGRANSLRYARAPRGAYRPCRRDLGRRGDSSIVEIPPSALVVPVNMSALRVFGLPTLCGTVRCLMRVSPILVFYVHPAELTPRDRLELPAGEPRRHRAGLGPQNMALLERFVQYVLSAGYTPAFMQPSACEALGVAA
jgi:peptidoglycan/xylan/chitin deacetylase (PgdA/CDA1 family)